MTPIFLQITFKMKDVLVFILYKGVELTPFSKG